ncbi:MAG TPA: aromatic ring-hydroxylating dioxygenase subunit alpha [Longimicrobium sp.]|nr:aromatic ring-hydroxylating dioxygenase subunit alpha [Longimicrobium sp.]
MDTPASAPAPTSSKSFATVVRLKDTWFIACHSKELGAKPISRVIQDLPLVLFRGEDGQAAALMDRCPHRNVPLSVGRVKGGQLECMYHGWRFDRAGECRAVPGFCGEPNAKSRRATAFPVLEQDGFVWVYSTPDAVPTSQPYRFPKLDDPAYTSVRRDFRVESTLHAIIENTLDVPHTAYLHGGLFRTPKARNEIEVVVRRSPAGVEAEYIGEPRPPGIAGRVLAPGGGVVRHFDRFLLPSIAQVEYQLGEKSHLMVTSAHTPVSDFDTRVYVVATFRLPIPHWLVRPVLTPVATRIFAQDAKMLRLQTQTLKRFGHESYASTEVDAIGPAALKLLRMVERGQPLPENPPEQRLKLRV